MRKKRNIQAGEKFEKLTVVKEIEPNISKSGQVQRKFLCICDCGKERKVQMCNLVSGNSTSCGCIKVLNMANVGSHFKTHGATNTTEYRSWYAMKARCYNRNYRNYIYWGGRGIKVCDRWLNSFQNFLDDMGYKPNNLYSLDRIDCNGDYEPNNCRWATRKQQQNNRRNNRPKKLQTIK